MPNRITVLHLTTSLGTGGMERQLLLTTPRLSSMNHVIVCLQQWGPVGDALRAQGFPVIHIPTRFPWDIAAALRLRAFVRLHRPGLMITYLPFADLFGRVWRRFLGVPKVACYLHSTMREWRYLPLILLNNLTQVLVHRFFAVSRAVQANYERWGLRPGVTDVVPNGIVSHHHSPPSGYEHDLRASLNISDSVRLAGYVAGLRKERGHLFLLHVVRELKRRGVRVHFLFIGSGPYQKKIEQVIKQLGVSDRISFLGLRSDVPELLRILDIYVHPSIYEGMSVALLEAMEAGRAIVTTDIPENRELLTNERSALLIARGDVSGFASAVERILINEVFANDLRSQAKRDAGNYNIDRTTEHLARVLSNLLSKP